MVRGKGSMRDKKKVSLSSKDSAYLEAFFILDFLVNRQLKHKYLNILDTFVFHLNLN